MLGLLVCLIVLMPLPAACHIAEAIPANLRGAWDLVRLAELIDGGFAGSPGGHQFGAAGSESGLDDLRAGLCQAVLVGRELSAEEMAGLSDTVIAYDGVCILVDENSYLGGEVAKYGPTGQKADGLRNLTTEDLKQIFSCWTLPLAARWTLKDSFYRRVYPQDLTSSLGYKIRDPETGQDLGQWVAENYIVPPPFCFPPGKYDMQSALYQALALDEEAVTAACSAYTTPQLFREEEMLSFEFMEGAPFASGTGSSFSFKLGFASLRTSQIAMNHIPVRVVSINGIDPTQDAAAVYDGSYALSRQIHLITSAEPSSGVTRLIDFLLSAEGQALIAEAGYLPLPPAEAS